MQFRFIKFAITFYMFFLFNNSFGQGEHNIWYFGDKAGIDFNTSPPTPLLDGKTSSQEISATQCDENGNLLFYVGPDTSASIYSIVWNKNHQKMQNGDSIQCTSSVTQGLLILPLDNFQKKFYLFSVGHETTPSFKVIMTLEYSIIDLNKNGGFGAVTEKNKILYADYVTQDTMVTEKLTAVKHANGRDYWLIAHLWGQVSSPSSYLPFWYGDCNIFIKYLVTPYGIKGPFYQNIGLMDNFGLWGQMKFNEQGEKLALVSEYTYQIPSFPYYGKIELYDFDRCTGELFNYNYIGDDPTSNSGNFYYGCSFSPSGKILYVSNKNRSGTSFLYQYDLESSNIIGTRNLMHTTGNLNFIGQQQLAPDKKIYISTAYGTYFPNNFYDSTNMNLSVINNPDVFGTGCNFSPFSYSLGGKRTFLGLPNTPTDNLGKIEGSPCDTIINETSFNLFPNPSNGTFSFTYYFDIKSPEMYIYNSLGQFVTKYKFDESGFGSGNITLDVSSGIYYYRIIADGNVLFRSKFIVVK